ncbi:hypothetical protein AK812_SmicGene1885 [Symbiodinium microadriaticum]|uniref:Uncharacterized protein n=1 Tax=Symbiodinium microadriaticum TaxID=2951 RepID=A0A1Q9F303_SYMMI|nr:hypothetical protein AK812_SmicGene1885 [Symbiodinium microadriaticum]
MDDHDYELINHELDDGDDVAVDNDDTGGISHQSADAADDADAGVMLEPHLAGEKLQGARHRGANLEVHG